MPRKAFGECELLEIMLEGADSVAVVLALISFAYAHDASKP